MTERPTDPYAPTPTDPYAPTTTDPYAPTTTSGSDESTTKQEARRVADTAASAGRGVADTAKDQASQVAQETKHQARSLLDTVNTEVRAQVGSQQNRIADALHSLSKELGSMASNSHESGWVTDVVQEASRRGGEVAHWLQDREPSDVLEAVRSYARRRPGTFLALCGLAGVVAGRITRSAVASHTSLDSPDRDDSPRALTGAASGTYAEPYPAIEPMTPVSAPGRSAGTFATETQTVTAPTQSVSTGVGPQDPLMSDLEGTRADQPETARRTTGGAPTYE